MASLFERKKTYEKKEQAEKIIIDRMCRLLHKSFGTETKIQCSWPINEQDIYNIYNTIPLGLSLSIELDACMTEKRLTESAKQKLARIARNSYYWLAEGGSNISSSHSVMTKQVFSRENSYTRKAVKYVVCRNIVLALRRHLEVHISACCTTIILSY